jgi:GT2 family glycosyltransferase
VNDAAVDVTVAMVTWNSERHLRDAFGSLPDGLAGVASWRLIVADNDSADATVELTRRLQPNATVVAMGRNAGYAAGLNAAVQAAGPSRAYLFLNPDVRLQHGSVHALLECARAKNIGIAVPRLVDPSGNLHTSLRREPSVARALGEAVLGGGRAGRYPRIGEMVVLPAFYGVATTADWASGAVMLVTHECLTAVGGWDESFFLYSEETDLALRARDAGYLLRYCPDATAMHVGGDSHISAPLYSLLTLNRVRLFRKRHGRAMSTAFWCAVALNEALRLHRPVHRAALRVLVEPYTRQRIPAWVPDPRQRAARVSTLSIPGAGPNASSSIQGMDPSRPVAAHGVSVSQNFVARTLDDVEGLRSAWDAADVDDIDSHIDYFLTVLRHASNVIRPHVVLLRRPGMADLMAIARIERLQMPLSLGYRTLAKPTLRAVVLTFGGLVGVRGPEDERLLVDELRRPLSTGEADLLILRKVDVTGTLPQIVVDGVGWLRRSHAQPETSRWVAQVPDSLDAFLSVRSTKTRQTLRRQDRRLERTYGEGLTLRRFEHPDEIVELFRDLEEVASKTYQRGLGAAYSGSPLDMALIESGLRGGWFRIWMLYVHGHPVAFWSGTTYAGTFATGTPGFDPEYTRDSVGRYTMLRMVEDLCADDRVTRLDFGHGDAEYKAAFATALRTESDVFIVRRGLRPVAVNLVATALFGVNSRARQVAQKTDWGRRLKREWRRRIASHATAGGPTD